MKSYDVIRNALEREHITGCTLSLRMGYNDGYMGDIFRRKNDPKVSTFAQILDALGYDLVARSREDGFEFEIDPL